MGSGFTFDLGFPTESVNPVGKLMDSFFFWRKWIASRLH